MVTSVAWQLHSSDRLAGDEDGGAPGDARRAVDGRRDAVTALVVPGEGSGSAGAVGPAAAPGAVTSVDE